MNQCKACNNKAKADGYCGKHTRIGLIEAAKAAGKELCNPLRGCFEEPIPGLKRCETCRASEREKEGTRYMQKKATAITLLEEQDLCTLCIKPFTKWNTTKGAAKRCRPCYDKQAAIELTRGARDRNYKEEAAKNLLHTFEATREGCRSGKRGRVIEWSLTFEEFAELVKKPCTYCASKQPVEIRGVDRIDNAKGYTPDNCTAACGPCNRMKHVYHPEFFIDHCRVLQSGCAAEHVTKWPEYYKHIANGFDYYKRMATIRRGQEWDLTKELYNTMIASACYLCGYALGPVGIDRVDPSQGYLVSNCKPCCSPCNMFKNSMPLDVFKELTAKIALIDPSIYRTIPRRAYLLGRSEKIELVE